MVNDASVLAGTPAKSLQAYKWLRQELSIWFSILTESQTSSAGQVPAEKPHNTGTARPGKKPGSSARRRKKAKAAAGSSSHAACGHGPQDHPATAGSLTQAAGGNGSQEFSATAGSLLHAADGDHTTAAVLESQVHDGQVIGRFGASANAKQAEYSDTDTGDACQARPAAAAASRPTGTSRGKSSHGGHASENLPQAQEAQGPWRVASQPSAASRSFAGSPAQVSTSNLPSAWRFGPHGHGPAPPANPRASTPISMQHQSISISNHVNSQSSTNQVPFPRAPSEKVPHIYSAAGSQECQEENNSDMAIFNSATTRATPRLRPVQSYITCQSIKLLEAPLCSTPEGQQGQGW